MFGGRVSGQHVQQHCTRYGDRHGMLAAGSASALYAQRGSERGSMSTSSRRPWPYLRSAVPVRWSLRGPSPLADAICWRASAQCSHPRADDLQATASTALIYAGKTSQSHFVFVGEVPCVSGRDMWQKDCDSRVLPQPSRTPCIAGPCARMVGSACNSPHHTRDLISAERTTAWPSSVTCTHEAHSNAVMSPAR